MIEFINYLTVILISALATFVFVRSGSTQSARYFLMTAGFLLLLRVASIFRTVDYSEQIAYVMIVFVSIALGGMFTSIVLFIGCLFFPEWWSGSRPIRWIIAPYIGITGLIVLDQILRTKILLDTLEVDGTIYRLRLTPLAETVINPLMLIGVLFAIGSLIAAFILNKRARKTIMLLIALLFGGAVLAQVVMFIPGTSEYSGQVQTILMVSAFGYIVLRERIFEPRRIGVRLAMEAMEDGVIITNIAGDIVFVNDSARKLGVQEQESAYTLFERLQIPTEVIGILFAPLKTPDTELNHAPIQVDQAYFDVVSQSLLDQAHNVVGLLLILQDRTELSQQAQKLDQEQQRLSELAGRLRQEQSQRSELAATVRALSLPIVPVLQGVLVLPLIGTFDQQRIQEFKQVLLNGIATMNASHVLLDMTGVELIDDRYIRGILEGIKAAELLGAACTLVGIRPEVAQSLVSQGIELHDVSSAATLREALDTHIKFVRA